MITLSRDGHQEKTPMTERGDTETEAAGGEVGPSQSLYRQGHITKVYLTDSDEEANVAHQMPGTQLSAFKLQAR